MQIGIPRESLAGETRVAATPSTVEQLRKLGFDVVVEAGAGALASFDDAAFSAAGATVVDTAAPVAIPADLQDQWPVRGRNGPAATGDHPGQPCGRRKTLTCRGLGCA